MKQSHSGNIYAKILLLTSILVIVFQFWSMLMASKSDKSTDASSTISAPITSGSGDIVAVKNTNQARFQSAYAANFGNVWVALSTRIGMQFSSGNSSAWNTFYREISILWKNVSERNTIREQLIAQNMLIIQEYLNLSRTDIKQMLNSSANREATLEWFISQLEMRYKNSALSIESLQAQKVLYVAEIDRLSQQIEQTKQTLETNFSQFNQQGAIADTQKYFELRADYTEVFTDVVFINQFLKQHQFLNNYNKTVLDTLINNKKALIQESFVVLPDSGTQFLKPLDLILDESEFKNNLSTQD